MNYQVSHFEEIKVTGEHVHISNDDPNMSEKFTELWQGFYQNHATMDMETKVYGVYFNFEGDYEKPTSLSYDVLAGVATADGEVTIQNGKYARFTVVGNPMTAPAALWQEIWQTQLERTCVTDFELYYPNPDIEKTRIEIYIGIK
ncbi:MULTISPECIES: GyrI-like domain-containing protein [Listeria]|uniref:GyrI-like domain-containing protein n=1 Tax=Listeria TaxID=1637 RepID=UPI000B58B95B|nr:MULTISPECIES: effector binding domain-containing protein [Listeria]